MTKIIMLLLCLLTSTAAFAAVEIQPTAFPVFLRNGFSTVLEFDEAPTRVVLGDTQFFQVERLEKSVVVKTRVPTAVSNMFVYFRTKAPRMFILTASEEAEPTYYKKFESVVPPAPILSAPTRSSNIARPRARLRLIQFNNKKDFLTVEIVLSANKLSRLLPDWQNVRLISGQSKVSPKKLWSERKDVQKDSSIKSRFVFYRPNIQKNLADTFLVVPLKDERRPLYLDLSKGLK